MSSALIIAKIRRKFNRIFKVDTYGNFLGCIVDVVIFKNGKGVRFREALSTKKE